MKKLITFFLALLLVLAMALPVSAATTGKWDFDAGAAHAQEVGQEMIREEAPTGFWDWLERWFLPLWEGWH